MKQQTFHYFASTALGWSAAETAVEAIEKLARAGGSIIKDMITREGSAYVFLCRVEKPVTAPYKIEFFQPEAGVPVSEGQHVHVTKLTAKDIKFIRVTEYAEDKYSEKAKKAKSKS